jgi:hypothetical protein
MNAAYRKIALRITWIVGIVLVGLFVQGNLQAQSLNEASGSKSPIMSGARVVTKRIVFVMESSNVLYTPEAGWQKTKNQDPAALLTNRESRVATGNVEVCCNELADVSVARAGR